MSCRIRLVLAIHNHQPIGNFDGVFEDAYRDSYAPFLDFLEEYPEIPVSLHNSGSLLEWLVANHPEYIERIKPLVRRGQVEILGGPFYEPILAGIPSRDRIGQIQAYSEYLENLFDCSVRGMWVPERVWEQNFASDIGRAGIEYTLLDDFHFRNAGLEDEQLHSYYLTEDEGRLLKVFPGSEKLRYTIPFQDPVATIDYLRDIAERHHNAVVVFGDDGEKFGTWPGTQKHVYEDGWLRQFFDTLRANREWLQVTTLAEAVDNVAPVGRIYLPDASYREMTEWALSTDSQIELKELDRHFGSQDQWQKVVPRLRGGFWRNFRVKYPEANEMYLRMMQISHRLHELSHDDASHCDPELIEAARAELYRAQCNCSYWHGAFGGLYLPHLRNAVYKHLIAADTLLDKAEGRDGQWAEVTVDDFNLDARAEIRLSGDRLVAFLAPSRGGHLYELDIRTAKHNLLATLNRRPEPYHAVVLEHGKEGGQNKHHGDGVGSIHDLVSFKQPDLDKKIAYDTWPRKSLVDHFLQPDLSLESFRKGEGQVGDFAIGVYESRVRQTDSLVEAELTRVGPVGPHQVKVTKTIALDSERGSRLHVRYQLSQLPVGAPIHFGVEFNFAGMAAGQPDRYFYGETGEQLGELQSVLDLPPTERLGLLDEWLGLDAAIETSQPAGFWTFPIETISQSEGGFEAVHQSTAVVPHWNIVADERGEWSVDLTLAIDTSAAQARQLREKAAVVG